MKRSENVGDNVSFRNYASTFKLASKSLYVRDIALILF